MKIIPASYEIMPDSMPIEKRIELSGRISYKSEGKINDNSAGPFIQKIIKNGHWPVLDMAAVHIVFECTDEIKSRACIDPVPGMSKYLQVSFFKEDRQTYCLMSGSVRALTEYFRKYPYFVGDIKQSLYLFSPVCFPSFDYGVSQSDFYSIFDNLSMFRTFTDEIIKKHHYVGVKFTVSRAITHEIVRHRPCGFLQESTRCCRYNEEITVIDPKAYKLNEQDYKMWQTACESAEIDYNLLLMGNPPQAARNILPHSTKSDIMVYCPLSQWEHILRLRTSPSADPAMREVMVPLAEEMKGKWPMIDLDKKPYSD